MKLNIIIQPFNLSVPSPDSHRMHGYISRFDDLCDNRQEQVAYFGNSGPYGTKHIAIKSLEFLEIYKQIKLAESPVKYFASFARLNKRKHAMLCIQRYLYELQRLVITEDVRRIVIFDPYILHIIWILTLYLKRNPYVQLNQRIQVIYTPDMHTLLTDSTLSKLIKDITLENAYPVHVLCVDYKLTNMVISSGIHSSHFVKLPHDIFDDSAVQLNNKQDKIYLVIPPEVLAKRETLSDKIDIRVPAYFQISSWNQSEPDREVAENTMYSVLEQIVDTLVQKCKHGDLRLARHLTHQGIHVTWDIACFYTADCEVNIQNQDELSKYFVEQDWQHILDCRLLSMSLLPYLGTVSLCVICELSWLYRTMGINLLSAKTPCLEFVDDNKLQYGPSSQSKPCLEHVNLPNPRILPEQPNEPITIYDTAFDSLDELQTVTYDFQPEHNIVTDPDSHIEDIWILDKDSEPVNNINKISIPKPVIPKPELTYHSVVMKEQHEPIIELKADDLLSTLNYKPTRGRLNSSGTSSAGSPTVPKFAPIVTKASLCESFVLDRADDEWLDGAQLLAKCSARPGHILAMSHTQLHTDSIHGSNQFRYEPAIMELVNAKYFKGLIPGHYDSPYKLYQAIGIESGLIMSKAQITRWFPDVIFEKNTVTEQIMCGTILDGEFSIISGFVTVNIYGRTVDYFLGRCNILHSNIIRDGTSNATTKYRLGILIQSGSGQSAGKIAEELLEMALAMVGRVSVVIAINISVGINGKLNDYSGILNRLRSVKLPNALFAYVITSTPDLGTDISPFFMQFHMLTNSHAMDNEGFGLGLDIDYILKLHTKTNNEWRKRLCRPFIGGLDLICGLLIRLDTDKTIGMLGAKECVCPNNLFCDTKLETYFPECTYTKYRALYRYVAGTVFLTRTHIIRDTIAMDPKFTKALLLMPYYYDNSLFPTNSPTHTFERIMGYLACKKYKQGVFGI